MNYKDDSDTCTNQESDFNEEESEGCESAPRRFSHGTLRWELELSGLSRNERDEIFLLEVIHRAASLCMLPPLEDLPCLHSFVLKTYDDRIEITGCPNICTSDSISPVGLYGDRVCIVVPIRIYVFGTPIDTDAVHTILEDYEPNDDESMLCISMVSHGLDPDDVSDVDDSTVLEVEEAAERLREILATHPSDDTCTLPVWCSGYPFDELYVGVMVGERISTCGGYTLRVEADNVRIEADVTPGNVLSRLYTYLHGKVVHGDVTEDQWIELMDGLFGGEVDFRV